MKNFEEYLEFAKQNNIDVTDISQISETEMTSAFDEDFVDFGIEVAPSETAEVTVQNSQKLAILLHGFRPIGGNFPFTQEQANRGDYADYTRFFKALQQHMQRLGYNSVVVAYDTHAPFYQTGAHLARYFATWGNRYDLSKTLLVGYSMGGLVARAMVSEGMPFARLYTTCTPHFGVLPYLNLTPVVQQFFMLNNGAKSMSTGSQDLLLINARDRQHHHKYHCHGINYTSVAIPSGFHNDDTITDCNMATMTYAQVAQRWSTHIGLMSSVDKRGPMEPHLRGYVDEEEWGSGRWAPDLFISQIHGA